MKTTSIFLLLIAVSFALMLSAHASSPENADRGMHVMEHASRNELAQLKARGFKRIAVVIKCRNVDMEAKKRSSADAATTSAVENMVMDRLKSVGIPLELNPAASFFPCLHVSSARWADSHDTTLGVSLIDECSNSTESGHMKQVIVWDHSSREPITQTEDIKNRLANYVDESIQIIKDFTQ